MESDSFERKQFTFYRSFYDALLRLPAKKRKDAAWMIIEYALNETFPTGADPTILAIFELLRPVLDKARTRAKVGAKGGEQSPSKAQANSKQNASKNKFASASVASKKEEEKEVKIEIELEQEGECKEGERVQGQTGADDAAFLELWEWLSRQGVRYLDQDEARQMYEQYGAYEIRRAVYRAYDMGKNVWGYIRGILVSGGANRTARDKNHIQQHGEPLSPAMQEAVNRMLERQRQEDESDDQ